MLTSLDFSWLSDQLYVRWLVQGTLMTIAVSVTGMAAAFAIGIAGATLIQLRVPVFRTLARILVDLFRNTPPLVQLFFLYFMLSDIGLSFTNAAGRNTPLF